MTNKENIHNAFVFLLKKMGITDTPDIEGGSHSVKELKLGEWDSTSPQMLVFYLTDRSLPDGYYSIRYKGVDYTNFSSSRGRWEIDEDDCPHPFDGSFNVNDWIDGWLEAAGVSKEEIALMKLQR